MPKQFDYNFIKKKYRQMTIKKDLNVRQIYYRIFLKPIISQIDWQLQIQINFNPNIL